MASSDIRTQLCLFCRCGNGVHRDWCQVGTTWRPIGEIIEAVFCGYGLADTVSGRPLFSRTTPPLLENDK